jgi:hypothetical protein
MAQTGYTPILIYSSSTVSQAPAAGNLTNSTLGSELAINITDGKLFYKDNANNVQVIAWKTTPTTAGGTGLTSYTAGDMLYYASGTALSKLAIGTSGQWLGSSGTAPQWNSPAALTKTDDTNVTLTLGGSASTALLNAASLTLGWTGQLAVTRGGTGLSSLTANRVLYASATNTVGTSSNFTYNGTDLAVTGGNFVVGTSGKGIDFSATPGTGTSELFADYEEGTWTPAFAAESGTATVTYTTQSGEYTKIGRTVICTFKMTWSAATITGNILLLSGVPFTSNAANMSGYVVEAYRVDFTNVSGSTGTQLMIMAYNTTNCAFMTAGDSLNPADGRLGPGVIAATGVLNGTLIYNV